MTPKQQRFVEEFAVDLNATQAAIRSGYSAKTAAQQAARLLTNVKVRAGVAARQSESAERLNLSKDWVLKQLVENVNRAMQSTPVKDGRGIPTGEYVYQGAVANKSLELLGKHLGMFRDELDIDFNDLSSISDAELERRRRELRIV